MPTINRQTTRKPPTQRLKESVIDRIAPIGFSPDDGIRILLYGRSGTGKTTLWATFPGPILAVVCSGGQRPGELRSVDTSEYRKKISQVALESTTEFGQLIEHARESDRFSTVVLDHASGLQDLTLKEILGLDRLPAQKGWGMATQQQYGQSSLMCKETFRDLLSLECNVVIIAQERTFGDDNNTSELLAPTVGAALTPSVTGWLGPACDYVCNTYIRPKMEQTRTKVGDKEIIGQKRGKGVEYCLRVEPHDVYMTKFRVPKGSVGLRDIVDPTFAKIQKLIQGGQ